MVHRHVSLALNRDTKQIGIEVIFFNKTTSLLILHVLAVEYSITLLLSTFDASWRESVIDELAKHFEIEKSRASDDETFIHVFYRPRKYFTDYFPLFLSYFLCMVREWCCLHYLKNIFSFIFTTRSPNSKWLKTNGHWRW